MFPVCFEGYWQCMNTDDRKQRQSKLNCSISEESSQHICSCGRQYRYKRGLSAHQKFECGKEPSFQCPMCSKKYTQPSALNYHMKTIHVETYTKDIIVK